MEILWRSGKDKLLSSGLKNSGMVSEKLYRNTLRPSTKNGWPSFCLQAIWSQLKCQNKGKATSGKNDLYRSVQLKIVSGKQKGKNIKTAEIVAHKQKGVKGRGGEGGRIFFSPAASIYK